MEKLVVCILNKNDGKNLNLNNLNDLKTLHVSNNLITVIENLPDGVEDFQKENLPSIEFRTSGEPDIKNREENAKRRLKKDFYNDLKQYFKLKNLYQKKEKELKRKAFERADTKKMAKLAVKKVKPKCIKCQKNVGTIFEKKITHIVPFVEMIKNHVNLISSYIAVITFIIMKVLTYSKIQLKILKQTSLNRKWTTFLDILTTKLLK